ncbi:uncharacterized protein LOC128342870 [Hemicordylus capensis]|uniref:uncharacterized protein LOC128342870 n=1 Tax=Hemicordylus capensis TaxID=884348 RepID=UPI0023043746|nr:uncharacterized protein LOC128342870 [Hemicordylus capensis]
MDFVPPKCHAKLLSRTDLWMWLLLLAPLNTYQTKLESQKHCLDISSKVIQEGGTIKVPLNVSQSVGDPSIWRSSSSEWVTACQLFYRSKTQDNITECKPLLSDFKEDVFLEGNVLTLQNVSRGASGIYKFLETRFETCVAWISVTVGEVPKRCSSDTFSIPENSSKTIRDSIANSSSLLALWKKNHSSGWQHIMNITNEHLHYFADEYKGHFAISDDRLIIKDARELLTGEYQLVDELCMQHFSLTVPAPSMCPTLYRYIPQDSRAFIPMTLAKSYTILCRVNTSSSLCDWILVASRGRSYYFNRGLKKRLFLYNMGLIIIQMSKDLEGEYHVLSGVNRTCTVRVLMTAVGKSPSGQWEKNWHYHWKKGPLLLHRILLLVPGIVFLCVLGLLWDWLTKMRSQLAISGEQQRANEHIQQVIIPLQHSQNL